LSSVDFLHLPDSTHFATVDLTIPRRSPTEFRPEMKNRDPFDHSTSSFPSFNTSTFFQTLYLTSRYLFASLVINLNLYNNSLDSTERENSRAGDRKGKGIEIMESDNLQPVTVRTFIFELLDRTIYHFAQGGREVASGRTSYPLFPSSPSYQSLSSLSEVLRPLAHSSQ